VKPKSETLYSCNSDGGGYKVNKFVDEEYKTSYSILNSEAQVYCDCLGFTHRSNCKHIKITSKFIKENKVDKGYLYNSEEDKFSKLEGSD
jgi:hypothetical protein